MTRWRGGSRQAGSLPHGVSLQIRDLERAADSVVLVLAELSTVLSIRLSCLLACVATLFPYRVDC